MKLILAAAIIALSTPTYAGAWAEIKAFKGKDVKVVSNDVVFVVKEHAKGKQQILIRVSLGRKNGKLKVGDIQQWPDSTFAKAGAVYIKSIGCKPSNDIHHIKSKFYTLSYTC